MDSGSNQDSTSTTNEDNEKSSMDIKKEDDDIALPEEADGKVADEAEPDDAKKKLAGQSPLKTLLLLMIGPFLQQVSGALYGIFSTVWISMGVGPIGVTAISTYTTFDTFGRCFGFFLCTAAATQIAALFGQKKGYEAPQVICDLLRLSIIIGIVVPAVLCPTVNMACRWFGAGDEVVELGYDYLLPILVTSVLCCFNVCNTGFLQAEGRTLLIGIIASCSLIGSMCIFGPLFVLAFKWGMTGAGVSTVMSDAIPAVALTICYFCGCFTVKPKLSGFLKAVSPYTYKALRVGVSQLISNLGMVIPGIIIRKLIGNSCDDEKSFNDALAGYAIIFRYQLIINCVCLSVGQGLIPAASYSYAAKDFIRFQKLAFHGIWISIVWSVLTNIFSWAIPREVSKIFGSDEGYLNYAEPMLFNGNALGLICWVRILSQAALQSMQKGGKAMILSVVTQLLAVIAFAYILYFTDKKNPTRLVWCYPLSYALGLFLGVGLVAPEFVRIHRWAKEQQEREDAELKGGSEINLEDINSEKDSHEEDGDGIILSSSEDNDDKKEKNENSDSTDPGDSHDTVSGEEHEVVNPVEI